MKQPKKLTRDQKELLNKRGMDPTVWMLAAEDKESYTFIHKHTDRLRVMMKPGFSR